MDRHDHLKLFLVNNLVDMDSSRNIFPVVYPMFHQRAHRITSIHDLVFLLFQMIKNRSNLVDGHSAERSPSRLDKFLRMSSYNCFFAVFLEFSKISLNRVNLLLLTIMSTRSSIISSSQGERHPLRFFFFFRPGSFETASTALS